MSSSREQRITEAFVTLATSLARGDDVLELVTELTTTAARLLDVASAGLLLADRQGALHLLAASSERTQDLETFQLQRDQGPCLDCYRTGMPVVAEDLVDETERWPQFARAAAEAGFLSVHALPLRFGSVTMGTLGLFGSHTGSLNDADLRLGQALADVATVSIVQDRTAADQESLNRQLQAALDSRIAVEQAKGLLAQLGGTDMNTAFARLRRYCRDRNERLSDVAHALATRQLAPELIHAHASTHAARPTRSQ